IARMRRAVSEYRVLGVRTTLPFFDRLLREPAFVAGDFDTSFATTLVGQADARPGRKGEVAVIAAAIRAFEERRQARARVLAPAASAWLDAARRDAHAARIGSHG
ncbi:MAG: hypothetical protein ACHP85_22400, partial [Burkholderiales bacterium]